MKAKKKYVNKLKKSSKTKTKSDTHHPGRSNISEDFLIRPLTEELQEAWFKIRSFGEALGEQRIYASGRAIMFSKKVCYTFVRPHKKFIETVIFLTESKKLKGFSTVRAVSKTKYAHTFKLVHSDQVEGELTSAMSRAFAETPAS